jgi:hypothetical protein
MGRRGRRAYLGIGCSLAIISSFALASSPALASGAVYAGEQYEPKLLAVAGSGDYRHVSIGGIAWTNWNQPVAEGKGTYTFQLCVPTYGPCSDAAFYGVPARVKLGGITTCKGRSYYTALEVTNEGSMENTLFVPFHRNLAACPIRRPSRR